jgi:putative two-component system response regulator
MHDQKRQVIMLVDDNQANLNIGKNMLKDSYEVYALPSAERMFKFLESVKPDLILLDIAMPGMDGFEVIKLLKADPRHAGVPVIFVTAMSEQTDELEGLSLGAVDYVTKPFSAAILLKRIENHLLIEQQKAELKDLNANLMVKVMEKATEIAGLQTSIVNVIAEMVEFRDMLTGEHIIRTQKYVELLLRRIINDNLYSAEVGEWENIDFIAPSTQLHDLGKLFISDTILNKPGRLTEEEFEIMKTHAAKGAEAIRRLGNKWDNHLFLHYAEIAASTHHEKWDGSGYPRGLAGRDIPLLGRLMAIAEVYDALTSARPYKTPLSAQESAQIIVKGSGSHFDPVLVDVFKEMENDFASVSKGN